jgi:NTP pyrophosphatase (non-canonical NTP hydrolase)
MDFLEYQTQVKKTAIYPNVGNNIAYPVLGLNGEAGEVAEKVKKLIRDSEGKLDDFHREELVKELGDVLWYVAALSFELGVDLNTVAEKNISKLTSREKRGVLHGDGDNR